MKERLSEKMFGKNGEISNRRALGLFLKGLTLSVRYPLDLDRQILENLRIRDEMLQLANKAEINEFKKKTREDSEGLE